MSTDKTCEPALVPIPSMLGLWRCPHCRLGLRVISKAPLPAGWSWNGRVFFHECKQADGSLGTFPARRIAAAF
jgi:hypothetical protein